MRKQGQFIIDTRIKFRNGRQREFILRIKKGSKKSWPELARYLDLHPHTVCSDWLSEKITIPQKKAKKLFRLFPFDEWKHIEKEWFLKKLPPKWGQIKGGGKNKKIINIPKNSIHLAEFLGCALGDGHLDAREFTLSCDTTQIRYVKYVKTLVKILFGLDSKIFLNPSNKNNIFLDVYSVSLINFLQMNRLRIGDKIRNKASLPGWVFYNKKFASAALRGLFDTDGGIYHKQKNYDRAIIEFQTKSLCINKNIIRLLNYIGFKSSKGNKGLNIRIQEQSEVHKFFKIVGSSNIKNIIRYREFVKNGKVPRRNDVIKLTNKYKNIKLPFKSHNCAFS